MADLDRGNIRVFEKGVHDQPYGDPEDVQSTFEQTRAEQVETKRLFDIAKKNGLFIDRETIDKFGDKLCTKTGECEIFYNEKESLIYKVKDPFAKWVIKNLHAEDAIYEHIIHNLLFPSTRNSSALLKMTVILELYCLSHSYLLPMPTLQTKSSFVI